MVVRVHRALRSPVSRSLTQIKGQHKLFRIFFMRFDIGEDPSNKPTGAQKATTNFRISTSIARGSKALA